MIAGTFLYSIWFCTFPGIAGLGLPLGSGCVRTQSIPWASILVVLGAYIVFLMTIPPRIRKALG